MLKMNYSDFKKKNYNQLIKECERRGIQHYDSKGNIFPADDLIGRIIAYDAYYEGRDDALNGRPLRQKQNVKITAASIVCGVKMLTLTSSN